MLSDHFKTMDNIIAADKESILAIDGFGDIMAKKCLRIFLQIRNQKQLVASLAEAGVNMNSKIRCEG
ncbi:MAG: hypothetical protein L6V88_04720 [Anaerotruncus sp.]|nr:MAG: hypothetical protein L6V88_04720 [Anaerotruncus sp.]